MRRRTSLSAMDSRHLNITYPIRKNKNASTVCKAYILIKAL